MRIKIFCLFLLFTTSTLSAQEGEFTVHTNGLIYSEETMSQLNRIVDSLNLKFKTCDLSKPYVAIPQAIGHFIKADKLASQAKVDIEKGISFEAFIKKYPLAKVEQHELILRHIRAESEEKPMIEYTAFGFNEWSGGSLEFSAVGHLPSNEMKGKWLYEFYPKVDEEGPTLYAFYFTENFKSNDLPETYARMVQYTECMVDTNNLIFYETSENYNRKPTSKRGAMGNFLKLIHNFPNKPKDLDYENYEEEEYEQYWQNYTRWDSLRTHWIKNELSKTDKFKELLAKGAEEALKDGTSDEEFEYYIGGYLSKEIELKLRRSRRVIGGCSQDQRPRLHAQRIAVLAAETINWDIFLRSHLDIMNDRFDRVSDGSYAWAGRQTYIREIEELGINVPELLMGICLRVNNPSQNHYFGSIGRVGRALAETQYAGEVEQKMLNMITDPTLDDYNRLLAYYLFFNYNYHLKDNDRKTINAEKLSYAVQTFPAPFIEKIKRE